MSEEERSNEGSPERERDESPNRPLGKKKVKNYLKKEKKKGIIYMSRVPTGMKPPKVRHTFEQFAEVTKVFLQPENDHNRQKRKSRGGNRKVRYLEGWVEFASKRQARKIAESLNGHPVGGKARINREELWNLKYLSGFKWYQLTEQIAQQEASRPIKVSRAISDARKETETLQAQLDEAKAVRAIEQRKKKHEGEQFEAPVKRNFKQYRARESSGVASGVLTNIFAKNE